MNLRTKLVQWLADLPAMGTPEDRSALLALAGPDSPCQDLQWYGNPEGFAERLLDALGSDGKAAVLAFLAALHSLPSLEEDVQRQEELAAFETRLAAMDDGEFEDTFLRFGGREMLEAMAEAPYEIPDFALTSPGDDPPPATSGGSAPEEEHGITDLPKTPSPPAPAPAPGRSARPGDTGGQGDVSYAGGVDVGRDLIGRDQVVHGDQVAGSKYEAGTINIYHGSPQPVSDSTLIEEAIRLDVAAPPAAILEVPFDLAVAVRQPGAPALAIEDLTQVKSQDGSVFRREEEEIVEYRVAVTAAGCDVQPSHYTLWLRPRANSAPCWFQLTPHRAGKQSVIVTAYQQDEAIAATTRLSIQIQVPVSPGP